MKIALSDLTTGASNPIKRVDVRLYVCILGAIKGPKLQKFALEIEAKVEFGNGRQVTQVLGLGFLQHGQRLAMTANTEIMNLYCNDMKHLGEVLAKSDILRGRIPTFDNATGLEIVRRLVKDLKRCSTVRTAT